jgi:hypothetical protein
MISWVLSTFDPNGHKASLQSRGLKQQRIDTAQPATTSRSTSQEVAQGEQEEATREVEGS